MIGRAAMASKLAFILLILAVFHQSSAEDVEKRGKGCSASKPVTVNCNCGTHSKLLLALLISMNHKLTKCLAQSGNNNNPLCKGKVPKNCLEVLKCGHKTSGVYRVNPDGTGSRSGSFQVYCDQKTSGGGWTVIQRRKDGSVNFYRGWNEYKNGFGNLNGEFWLGLDKIHRLTYQTKNKLRVELEDTTGKTAYAEYSFFSVANENHKYKLHVGSYSGTAGDSLTYHNNMAFSTKDRDNDNNSGSCAQTYKGAWWYNTCHKSNLNGLYLLGKHKSYANGIIWVTWKGYYYSAKRDEMKIRPMK